MRIEFELWQEQSAGGEPREVEVCPGEERRGEEDDRSRAGGLGRTKLQRIGKESC